MRGLTLYMDIDYMKSKSKDDSLIFKYFRANLNSQVENKSLIIVIEPYL